MTNRISHSARRVCDDLAKKYGTLPVFLVVAALLHLALVPFIISLILDTDESLSSGRAMAVDLWSKTDAPEADDIDLDDDARVVTPDNSDSPPSTTATKYLSSMGSSASRETRQRGKGRFQSTRTSGKSAATSQQQVPPGNLSGSGEYPSDDFVYESGDEPVNEVTEPDEPTPPVALKLKPDDATLSSAIAGSGLADLGDIDDGDETAVNSRAFRHASFFSRVQKMVEQYWRPDIAMEHNDPEAKVIGTKTRVTTLLVVLKRDGRIHQLYVLNPSGASFLDDEAMDAVNKAGPFPNVPEGLINQNDDLVKFLFQFTVEINQRPVMRVRRYQ